MTDGLLRVTKYSMKSLWLSGAVITVVLVMPSVGLRFLGFLDEISSERQFKLITGFFSGIHFAFLCISGGVFLIFCLRELIFKQKLMSRMPVATAEFVSGQILSTLVIVIMVSLVSNGVFRLLLFDADSFRKFWPVMGPILFFLTLIVVVHCIYWDLQRLGFVRVLFWFSFVLGMCYWFKSRYYPDGFDGYPTPWSKVTWPEFFTMLIVFVAAWILAIRSCAQIRCGNAVSSQMWERVWRLVGKLGHFTWTARPGKSDSVTSAFARLYWRDNCSSVMLFWVLLGSSLVVTNLLSGASRRDIIGVTYVFLCLSSFLVSLLLGASFEGRHQLKGYLAIVPLSDRDMASIFVRAILKLVVLSVSSILLLGLIGGSLISLILQGIETTRDTGLWRMIGESRVGFIYLSSLLLLSCWVMISNLTTLLFTQNRACYGIFFTFPWLMVILGLLIKFVDLSSSIIGDVIFLSMSALIWSVTIFAYVHAYQRGLIHDRVLWLAALFCLLVPVVYWNFWETNGLPLRVCLSSLLVLAATPFATIPLAVSWNRHR